MPSGIATRLRRLLPALALASMLAAAAPGRAADAAMPSFDELEAAGARIGRVDVRTEDVFDTSDPREDNVLFRAANTLHVVSRPSLIRRMLLFAPGEAVSARTIAETERVLRATRFLYDVSIRPVAVNDGVVDIEVRTRDTWTLQPGIGVSRSGGTGSGSVEIRDTNLLGTGLAVGIARTSNVDRSGTELSVSHDHAFDGWTQVGFQDSRYDDGTRRTARLVRPFAELDARWAAGVSAVRDDRLEAVYSAGEIISRYRRAQQGADAFVGWSQGLVDGWVTRWSAGVAAREDAYAREPGQVAPPVLSPDETLVGPYVRWERIHDDFVASRNLNQIGRPEYLALGLQTAVQLGWAARAFGSTRDALVYQASASVGTEPAPRHTLLASGNLSGTWSDGAISRQRTGGQVQYYLPQGGRWLFYASASGDVLTNPAPLDMLTLGGDNGLRGYPLRYQSGTRRALFTFEERYYTDLYWFRLFRVGAAAFADVGRAWGGEDPAGAANTANPGWLSNVGFGLRIFSVRAAFSNVVHLDVAIPLDAQGNISRVQFLVKSKASF